MTHTPPIPAGNQSPYPLQEARHMPAQDRSTDATSVKDDTAVSRLADLPLATIGTAVGIGAALIGGVLLGLGSASARAKRKGRGRARRG
ncbi:MAG: hypothetical protein V4537_01255 [Pseudomonadota bacterium]